MKKILYSILVVFTCLCLIGCGKKEDVELNDTKEVKSGSWSINGNIKNTVISEEAKKAFDKAVAENDGMTFEPVALLGTQVVAGTNYMFLCKGTTVTQNPVTSLKVVVVYNDLKNNASISKVSDFDLEKYVSKNIDYNAEELVGGWNVNKDFADAALPSDADKAFKGIALTGASYTPIALLGTQVVAGTNYAILALGKTSTQEPVYTINVLTIYNDLSNNSSLTSIANVDLKEFNQ